MVRHALHNIRHGGALVLNGRNIMLHGGELYGNLTPAVALCQKGESAKADYIAAKKRITPLKYKF